MRKENYAYFVTTNGTPRDNGSKTLEKRETLPVTSRAKGEGSLDFGCKGGG